VDGAAPSSMPVRYFHDHSASDQCEIERFEP
jgi:hypothetical protein